MNHVADGSASGERSIAVSGKAPAIASMSSRVDTTPSVARALVGTSWALRSLRVVCRCGLDVDQPWRDRNTVWSPASVLGGVVLIALGVSAVVWFNPVFGGVLLGVFAVAVVIAAVVQARRGHRGWCLALRAVWFGLAAPGAPVRLIVNAP